MRQLPAWDRIGNIKLVLGRLEQELDTGMAIIGHTYVEAYLAHALISHLFWSGVAVQAPWTARVFGGSRRGPHETLVANLSASRKAEWCRMEGLVDDEVLGDVELIRRVRNEFAHCVDYTLVEELPRKLLDQLEESDTRMLSSLDGETGLRGKLMNLILKS